MFHTIMHHIDITHSHITTYTITHTDTDILSINPW